MKPLDPKNKENNLAMMDGSKKRPMDANGASTSRPKKSKLDSLSLSSSSRSVTREPSPELRSDTERRRSPSPDRRSAGRILSVELKNFMVYRNKTIVPGQYVNFVTGRNGSGKSSFASAILLGLGQRCSLSGRDVNAGDFIRNGCRTARIRITLSNEGDNAYEPEQMGSKITIERTIKTKSSEYKISSDGKSWEPLKKTKLDYIVEKRFRIRMENPVFFLNQQMSKDFLKLFKPSELYSFFFRAYGLNDVEITTRDNAHKLETAQNLIKKKTDELLIEENDLKMWQEREMMAISTGDLTIRIRDLAVQQDLAKLEKLDGEISTAMEELDELEKKLERENRVLGIRQDLNDLQISQILSQFDLSELKLAKKEYEDKQGELEAAKTARAALGASMKRSVLSASRSSLRGGTSANNGYDNDDVKQESRHDSMNGSLNDEDDAVVGWQSERDRIDKELNVVNKSLAEIKLTPQFLEKARQDLNRIQEEVNALKDAETPRCSPEILAAIDANQWSFTPIGPLGSLITIKPGNHTAAADFAVSPFSSAFIVTDQADEEPLLEIFRDHHVLPPPIYVIDGEKVKKTASAERPDLSLIAGAVNLDDCVEIADGLEKTFINTLLHTGIGANQILLVDHSQTARNLFAERRANVRKVYDGEGFCYDLVNDRVSWVAPKLSQASTEDRLVHLRDLLAQQEELHGRIIDLEAKERRLNELEVRWSKLTSEIKEVEISMQHETTNHGDTSERTTRTSLRKASSRSSHITHITHMEKVAGLFDSQPQQTEEWKRAQMLVDTLEAELDGIRKRIAAIEKKNKSRNASTPAKKKNSEKIKLALQKDVKKLEKRKADCLEQREKIKEIWQDQGVDLNDVELGMPWAESTRQLQALEVERANLMAGSTAHSKEQCQDSIRSKQSHIDICRETMKEAEELIKGMADNRDLRVPCHEKNELNCQRIASVKCLSILKERDYSGELQFDSDQRTLVYKVCVPGNKTPLSVEKLSGGEKAFSMAAFLGAMWEMGSAPFRILDEFDVYMDNKNREVALACLVQQAAKDHVQCFFLSPTDIDFSRVQPKDSKGMDNFITRIETDLPRTVAEDDSDEDD